MWKVNYPPVPGTMELVLLMSCKEEPHWESVLSGEEHPAQHPYIVGG